MSAFSPLYELAHRHGTDKGWRHKYTEVYYDIFKDRVDKVRGVFEFGVKLGASLRMWRDFFPKAQVFGFDKKEYTLITEERITCFLGNQNNENDIEKSGKKASSIAPLDLIVDDGSHKWESQLFTAQKMLPFLAKKGIYVIEDVKNAGHDNIEDPHRICQALIDKEHSACWIRTGDGSDSVLIIVQGK
jgi:hypothetical protein